MKKATRIRYILEFLERHDNASIHELSEQFGVSVMTIRRDLSALEEQSLVRLFHGGVILNRSAPGQSPESDSDYELLSAESKHREEKQRIGKKAASLVEPHDVIVIDTGTTTECIVRALPSSMPVSIICYTLNSLQVAARMKNADLISPGGYYHADAMMFESPEGIELIRANRATKAFLSAAGVHPRLGLTTLSYETPTKRAVISSSLTKILVVDSSKFGVVYPGHYADLQDLDMVITDSGISASHEQELRELGVDLQIV